MQVIVKGMSGDSTVVECNENDTVQQFQQSVSNYIGNPASGFVFAGKNLENGRTLGSYNITSDAVIYCVNNSNSHVQIVRRPYTMQFTIILKLKVRFTSKQDKYQTKYEFFYYSKAKSSDSVKMLQDRIAEEFECPIPILEVQDDNTEHQQLNPNSSLRENGVSNFFNTILVTCLAEYSNSFLWLCHHQIPTNNTQQFLKELESKNDEIEHIQLQLRTTYEQLQHSNQKIDLLETTQSNALQRELAIENQKLKTDVSANYTIIQNYDNQVRELQQQIINLKESARVAVQNPGKDMEIQNLSDQVQVLTLHLQNELQRVQQLQVYQQMPQFVQQQQQQLQLLSQQLQQYQAEIQFLQNKVMQLEMAQTTNPTDMALLKMKSDGQEKQIADLNSNILHLQNQIKDFTIKNRRVVDKLYEMYDRYPENAKYQCEVCEMVFTKREDIAAHKMMHNSANINIFQ